MASIFQTTFSIAFSWMKVFKFRLRFRCSGKYVPKGPINNIPAFVQVMAWRQSGNKPLSEPMMVSLLTHICVTRPQCHYDKKCKAMCSDNIAIIGSDNDLLSLRHQAISWTNADLLSILPWAKSFSETLIEIQTFSFKKMLLKMLSANSQTFCLGLNVLTRY